MSEYRQSVGLTGWMISPSLGRATYTGQHKHYFLIYLLLSNRPALYSLELLITSLNKLQKKIGPILQLPSRYSKRTSVLLTGSFMLDWRFSQRKPCRVQSSGFNIVWCSLACRLLLAGFLLGLLFVPEDGSGSILQNIFVLLPNCTILRPPNIVLFMCVKIKRVF
jgi:hypothetical protein